MQVPRLNLKDPAMIQMAEKQQAQGHYHADIETTNVPPSERHAVNPAGDDKFQELDEAHDLQLHPLQESTWTEIFPILSFFRAFRSNESIQKEQLNDP